MNETLRVERNHIVVKKKQNKTQVFTSPPDPLVAAAAHAAAGSPFI